MASLIVAYIVLLGTAVSLQSVSALECYRCTPSDSNCKDPFDKTGQVYKQSCPGFCYKMKLRSSDTDVHRGCVVGDSSDPSCKDISDMEIRDQTCTCITDLCNSVLPVGGSFIVPVTSFVIYLVHF